MVWCRGHHAKALAQSQHRGPAPVSLAACQAQVGKQAIANENLGEDAMRRGFSGLNMPANFVRKLLPAVRAGRTVLLYGPPGNEKTSVGSRIADMFRWKASMPGGRRAGVRSRWRAENSR